MARVKSKYTGGRLRFYNGPVDFNMTSESTAGATLRNWGISTVTSTNVCTLAAPSSGCQKTILFYGTTLPMVVKTTGAIFNKQSKQDVLHVTLSTASAKEIGYAVRLIGNGTTNWWLDGSAHTYTTAFAAGFSITSAT